jgi:uncharacterized membrane protein
MKDGKFKKIKKIIKKYGIYWVLALATFLRVFRISKRDFWYDEAFTGVAIKENFSGMLDMIIQDVHPPLYYISVKLFASLFNYSVFGIRFYSAILGILGIWAVYLFAKELFNKKVALWSSFLVTISPFAIQYSQEARMYSMLGFLIVIATYFFIRWLKRNETISYLLFGIFLGLSFLTHYMGIIFAPMFYFVFLVWRFKENKSLDKKFDFRKILQDLIPKKELIFSYLLAFLIFTPWLNIFLKHFNGRDNLHWTIPATLGDIFLNIQIFIFGSPIGEMSAGIPEPNKFYGVAPITALIMVTIFISLLILFLLKREKEKIIIVLLLSFGFMLMVYFLSLLGRHYFIARFLIASSYFIFILLGIWLSRIKFRFSIYFLVFYIFFLVSIMNVGYSKGFNKLTDNLDKYQNNDFYLLNSFDYVIAKYYLGTEKLTLFNIDWPEYDSSIWAAIGTNLKKIERYEDLKNNKNALVIFNSQCSFESRSDKSFDPYKDNFSLIEEYENIKIYKFKGNRSSEKN